MKYVPAPGDRVWWSTTDTTRCHGTVRVIEHNQVGVAPDGEHDLLYLDPTQLHPQSELPDGI